MDIPELDYWWLLIPILLASLLYLYGTWTFDYWKKRGVPFVKPTPFVGSTLDQLLARRTLTDIYQEIYDNLEPYPFGGFFRFREPILLARDPDLVKAVMVKDFFSFHENGIKLDVDLDPIFGRNPLVLTGERWKITRSHLTPAFTSAKLKPLFPLILEVLEELKEYVEQSKHSGDGIDARELCAKYTTDVVATCAFGIRGDALQNPNSEIREVGRAILHPGFWRNVIFSMVFMLPSVAKMLHLRISTKVVDKFFERITREVLDYREKTNSRRNDFIQILIDIKNKFSARNKEEDYDPKEFAPEKRFTNVDIMAHAATFFTDGFETTSLVLAFGLYELAMHPDVQEKLYLEVEDYFNMNDGRLTFDALQEMTYMEMVLSETLRLHPAAALLMKVCTKPYELETPSGRKFKLEVGTQVHIPLQALHSDAKYFPDPKKFDPERFSEENKDSFNKNAYLPFGDGPRTCIGFRFGKMQVKAAFAYLVHYFEIRPTNKTPNPVVLDPGYFLPVAKGGLWLDFVKRKNVENL